jgi:hypothetical protein
MSRSCGDRAACACVCMRHGCVSTACHVRCVVELHGVWCDPSGAASASCALVRVVGVAEACRSSDRVGQREFVLKERCLGYKNTLYSSLYKRSREIHKTACVRCCVWAQLLSRLLFIFFFCLLCEVERPSASQSRWLIPPRADGRSHQEPTVDPPKSRWSIPARADGRSQQLVSEQGSSRSRCRCRRCDGVRWRQWRRGRWAVCRPVRGC